MLRKLSLVAVAAASLGVAALAPTSASAWYGHGGWHHGGWHHGGWGWGGPRFYAGGPGYGYGYGGSRVPRLNHGLPTLRRFDATSRRFTFCYYDTTGFTFMKLL